MLYMWLNLKKAGFYAQLWIFRNTDFNYLKYWSIVSQQGNRIWCLHVIWWSIYAPTVEWTTSWIAHHFWYIIFCWHSQYHKYFYRVEGKGEPQSGRQRLHNTENSQMASIGAIFSSTCTYHTIQLNHGQTHQSVVLWIIAGCLLVQGRLSF